MHILCHRAGEGAGDQILALNCAHAWARTYQTPVELEYHWVSDSDFKYMDCDPETMLERMCMMEERMLQSRYPVHVEHVWGSDLFDYHGATAMTQEALEHRRLVKPVKWFLPFEKIHNISRKSKRLHPGNVPFGAQAGNAHWTWKDTPTSTNKIVMWDHSLNRESVKDYKVTDEELRGDLTWVDVRAHVESCFPDHEIVSLSYRDSFLKAYEEIRTCKFVVGYDGMWHQVARNFGKLFVVATDNIIHTYRMTNPYSSAFRTFKELNSYIDRLAHEKGFLDLEVNQAARYHEIRMEWYERNSPTV